jgi:hypothetical protein
MAVDKITKRRIITVTVLICLAVLSILVCTLIPGGAIQATDNADVQALQGPDSISDLNAGLNKGDISWMLTSSAFVLIMTPGLGFFYGGMVSGGSSGATAKMPTEGSQCAVAMAGAAQERHLDAPAELHGHGHRQRPLGDHRVGAQG